MQKLVIVESPNKVKAIQKYLGNDYIVESSVGHIVKLKTSGQYGLGIDLENWEPQYSLERGKGELVKKLKKLASQAELVYIATDPDREGEAIGDNLVKYLKVEDKYKRIKYNEITKEAILNSIDKAGLIDESLVNAQKSRRMLDRIIGFRLSQLMKQKMKNTPTNPSAGRVQSIALKLVVDREREIQSFVPEEFYRLNALISKENEISAYYINEKNPSDKKDWILPNEIEDIKKYFESANKNLKVVDIKISERKVASVTPFKQAVLYKRSPLSSISTQIAAQKLYEGYGEGGLISYPRTDSTRMSQSFINTAQKYIEQKWGKEYVATKINGISGDQDAHEAIRPTDINLTPILAKAKYPEMTDNEFKIYRLIYNVTMQSLITQPIRINKTYTYKNGEYVFKNSFSSVKFDGYYVIESEKEQDLKDPNYTLEQVVDVEEFVFSDHQTKPAPRYTEGSLIEALDNIKVGRPSTFATTVKIIKDRLYVKNEGSQLVPTEFGINVLDKLITSFQDIINEEYTAKVEQELDDISENKINYKNVMQEFWDRFTITLETAKETMQQTSLKQELLDELCPECQKQLIIRYNKKRQKFIACTGFPNCKYTRSIDTKKEQNDSNINATA
ncbi:type I DNA topoisomerase [Mycoplasmopsis ciconiae]|uniref:DNA topoisomerase 1 n=1 Tax=Mycoplasmopsis ciconiae TaxID=561067 RepID=A0ABU7MKI5_9BACT|nr:type I DNA topoisomerase [Mycoplasmopsis ciconiae]